MEKKNARNARINRTRRPKRQNMTLEIYQWIIQQHFKTNYKSCRLRIAFCLLFITGIRISELLPFKLSQIKTLLKNNWIAVPRLKPGLSNYKAFLSKEGSRILNERKLDFELLLYSKTDDLFIFTSENKPNEHIRR